MLIAVLKISVGAVCNTHGVNRPNMWHTHIIEIDAFARRDIDIATGAVLVAATANADDRERPEHECCVTIH
jgi:hypothetical protein